MKEELKEYFSFSKSQSRGIILLSILCCICIAVFFSLDYWVGPPPKEQMSDADFQEVLASIYIDTSYKQKQDRSRELKPFNFNPNTLSEKGFVKLGLSAKLAKTILNYRNKGGKFYKKEDFKKIWGLHKNEYKRLAPFIVIPKSQNVYTKFDTKKNKPSSTKESNLNIEINTASAEDFTQLYGIADKLAGNILKYRELLGGFYSVNQLKEVYGIRTETFLGIKRHLHCDTNNLKKININEATLYEMRAHPYLRKNNIALSITKFRKTQDYDIKALEDLKNIEGMTNETYLKIVPYLSLQ